MKNVFLTGADGFIGSHVGSVLKKQYSVMESMYGTGDYRLDLSSYDEVEYMLQRLQPDAVVHCAGIVDKSEKARMNVIFTANLLRAVGTLRQPPKKIIICGSASEYGIVKTDLPIPENYDRHPVGEYGIAKAAETDLALRFAHQANSQVIVARLFNPVGGGMPENMLIPDLLRQLTAIQNGAQKELVVSRLDARRDYISVWDVAAAFSALITNHTKNAVYNIGRGQSVTTEGLVNTLLRLKGMSPIHDIRETSREPEPMLASLADISRIMKDTAWRPKYDLEETLREII